MPGAIEIEMGWGGGWGELGGVLSQCFWLLTSSDCCQVCILSLETLLVTPVLVCIAGQAQVARGTSFTHQQVDS